MATAANGKRPVMSRETMVPVGAVVIVLGLVLSWAVKDATWKTNIQRDVQAIVSNSKDVWYRTQMMLWTLKAEKMNPELELPSVEDIPSAGGP